ncbi:MAG: hypothetical protein ACRDPY_27535 [Streptosporangiaceae bacterium]
MPTPDRHPGRSLTDLIAVELRALRKGKGLQSADLARRVGSQLRELAAEVGTSVEADAATLRYRLAAELESRASQLSEDSRVAIRASLGLSSQTRQMRLFSDRVSWLAIQIDREYRTALRRIEDAEQLLAEEIALELYRRRSQAVTAPQGWYLDEFRAVLRLDTPAPQSLEHRRIIATKAGLQEIMAWVDVPGEGPGRHGPRASAEVLYGGRLLKQEQPSPGRFQFVVRLPVALQPGDQHEYGLAMYMPEDEPMRPHAIFVPECVCNTFDLTVRFGVGRVPAWIRRVDGEPVRVFDAARPPAQVIVPDESGEVHVRFTHPAMNLGYGLQWH